jgi:hypothetical protein
VCAIPRYSIEGTEEDITAIPDEAPFMHILDYLGEETLSGDGPIEVADLTGKWVNALYNAGLGPVGESVGVVALRSDGHVLSMRNVQDAKEFRMLIADCAKALHLRL